METQTPTQDLRSQVIERAAELREYDLRLIRGFAAGRLDDKPFDGNDLDGLVDVLERRRIPIEHLDEFVEVLQADRLNAPTIENHARNLADLDAQGEAASTRKAAIEAELIGLRNKISWVSTMRSTAFEALRQAKALRVANPLLFGDDVDTALEQQRAVLPEQVARSYSEQPHPLENIGRRI